MRDATLARFREHRLIAILRDISEEQCLPLAAALLAGGFRLLEITFDPARPESFSATARTIEALGRRFDGELCIGAGTVLSPETAVLAHRAGAAFLLSPNADPKVICRTRELELVSIPGALTPTEIAAAFSAGADLVKVFPASLLGPGYFKALKGPLPHIPLLAVGGVAHTDLAAYLSAGAAGAGVGGSLVNKKLLDQGDFPAITALARRYVDAMTEVRL
ncbi:MAG: bifunctional 4-hydroxy-2-oxoglutarate aldolase/2-dehydro-3-deoxy-phosphogluconate aldolase [Bacillota bacterium]|nr:bifunctional 4-hydroxy-2-oxoglutarate aldolase/2-dehydro-3-deoxy-phosphogluconate aldolase [Bacillota bacterium]